MVPVFQDVWRICKIFCFTPLVRPIWLCHNNPAISCDAPRGHISPKRRLDVTPGARRGAKRAGDLSSATIAYEARHHHASLISVSAPI